MWMDGKLVGRAGHHGILRRPGPEGRGVLVGRWDVLRLLHRRVSPHHLRVRAIVGALVAQPAGTGKNEENKRHVDGGERGGYSFVACLCHLTIMVVISIVASTVP